VSSGNGDALTVFTDLRRDGGELGTMDKEDVRHPLSV
jgi:hypothetical protein